MMHIPLTSQSIITASFSGLTETLTTLSWSEQKEREGGMAETQKRVNENRIHLS